MSVRTAAIISAVALFAASQAAMAELAVSANDGKQLRKGDPTPVTPDTVAVLDLAHYPPRKIGSVEAPASMIGPPAAVAVSAKGRFAIVTAGQKINPADPGKPLPGDTVSVIDLSVPSKPKVLQTLHAGPGASGVSINRAGTLALVASTGDDSISIFSISGRHLAPAGKVQLSPKARPTDVVFTPDGRTALAVEQGTSQIVRLAVDGTNVTATGVSVMPGWQPYGAVVTHDGAYLINTDLGGGPDAPRPTHGMRPVGALSVIDLKSLKVVRSVPVGPVPEHVALSADGRYLEVTVANGSAATKTDPSYGKVFGLMKIFRVDGPDLTLLASVDTGHWCQGATWSDDDRVILLQCAAEREIEVYRFDGKSVTRDNAATLSFRSRPGSIATARSR